MTVGSVRTQRSYSCKNVLCALFQHLKDRQWHSLPNMPAKKRWSQAVQLEEYAVVLGGETKRFETCRRVFAFSTLQEVWAEWVPVPNYDCGAASDGVRLIVAGGFSPSSGKPVSDVYELNKDHDGWLKLPSMPKACTNCSATILKNKLYVMAIAEFPTMAVQMLNLKDGKWSEITMTKTIPDRLIGRWTNLSVVGLGDFIVSDRLVAYNTTSGQSKDLPVTPGSKDPSSIPTLAVVNDRLLALGQSFRDRKVHMLSSDLQRWDKVRSLKVGRYAPAACTVNGIVYVMGGSDHRSTLSSAECFKWSPHPRQNSNINIEHRHNRHVTRTTNEPPSSSHNLLKHSLIIRRSSDASSAKLPASQGTFHIGTLLFNVFSYLICAKSQRRYQNFDDFRPD